MLRQVSSAKWIGKDDGRHYRQGAANCNPQCHKYSIMRGTPSITFSELFADTIRTHGETWAFCHYVIKHKMAEWEFNFWKKAVQA